MSAKNAAYADALKEWVYRYNGYERIAGPPEKLGEIVAPLDAAYSETGKVPYWAGIDLLRAWAFLIARSHNHACMSDAPLHVCHPAIAEIASAVAVHKGLKKGEGPPPPPPSQ